MQGVARLITFLTLACTVAPVQGHGTETPSKYIFLIGPTPTKIAEPKKGWLHIACVTPPCRVDCSLFLNQSKILTMRETNNIKLPFLSHNNRYPLVRQSVESRSQIMVYASISSTGSPLEVYTFSIYPILNRDTFFVMTAPSGTEFLYLLARDEETHVRITCFSSRTDQGTQMALWPIKKKLGSIFRLRDPYYYKLYTDAYVRADKPISVYFGRKNTLRGAIPALRKAGREFIFGPMEVLRFSFKIFVPTCATVKMWELRYDLGRTFLYHDEYETCKDVCKPIHLVWVGRSFQLRAVRVSASVDVLMLITYETEDYKAIQTAFVVPPMSYYKSEYIVSITNNFPHIKEPKVGMIVSLFDKDNILVNGDRLSTYSDKAGGQSMSFPISGDEFYYLYSNLRFYGSDTLHMMVDPRVPDPGNVMFGVYLYGPYDDPTFITPIGGFCHYDDEEKYYNYSVLNRLDNCSNLKDLFTKHIYHVPELPNDESSLDNKEAVIILSTLGPLTMALVAFTIYSLYITNLSLHHHPPDTTAQPPQIEMTGSTSSANPTPNDS